MSTAPAHDSERSLPELGVGITYSPAIEPLLEQHPDLIDVLEVEPQTTWVETGDAEAPYRIEEAVLDHIEQLPGRKLVHSIGVPVGGTVRPDPCQLRLLRRTLERFGSPWVSEHLSFNETHEFRTGFFLPPRQTPRGVEVAVECIREVQSALPAPLAVETGVNYLRPRSDELADGAFVAAVVEEADCGLLLDLHNVFTNAVNGRQPIEEFLGEIPLERVWEVHLAGGLEMEGFWLDAHSGAVPDPLLDIAERVLPSMPALRAIVFEMYPSFVDGTGLDIIREQLERIRGLWQLRGRSTGGAASRDRPRRSAPGADAPPPEAWEEALGALVIGRTTEGEMAEELADDPGVALVNKLVAEFRASMLVSVLRLTCRLLMLALGEEVFRGLLQDFWSKTSPRLYASSEAEAFADYLRDLDLRLPRLADVLQYEHAVLQTMKQGEPQTVRFDFNPFPLFRALSEGRLPDLAGAPGDFEIRITPDGPLRVEGMEEADLRRTFRFH